MNRTQKVVGSLAVASLLAIAPIAASADTLSARGATGVVINPSGMVRVIGADVTAVSNGVINAATTIGSTVLNWVVDLSASTSMQAGGAKSASSSDIKVGDMIAFSGKLSSTTSSALTVAATKVRDLTTSPFRRIGMGVIANVNSANGSFTITKGNHVITVQTNASTLISVNGATSTLASLAAGEKVMVSGVANSDVSVITASKVVVKTSLDKGQKDTDGDQNNEISKGMHAGLNFLSGLHIGKDK